ncbi:hypothetical protein LSH36_274g06029 [Paralvinella palmiformis]|uniref:RING-type domain-containing protein n=1 Tax=Paralvinella palmiformis TaxID=53620 RepID=A0AAD9JJ95_9ANNE|nr:hypothetical protein LSH36_274g06029 [Paralvinella palmiformis]
MKTKNNIMERKIRLRTLNSHITCFLCKGYLVDATTITECLHTFCKSCIVKYLQRNVTCPKCGGVIHQSHPLNYISHDRTMQDIVYKLVPGLQEDEREKHESYCVKHGLPLPKANSGNEDNPNPHQNNNCTAVTKAASDTSAPSTQDDSQDYHRYDEQVNLYLECQSHQLKSLKRKFIRCSSHATITHLKKFLALKLFNNLEKFRSVDIMLNNEILGKDHTLKFIWVTRWRLKQPLELQYRPRVEL